MNFFTYLGIDKQEFIDKYIMTRLVNQQLHKEFPLDIFTYGREAVHGHVWNSVTRKCRGIIVNRETEEIVARPFEKFFNFGTADMPETDPNNWESEMNTDNAVWMSQPPTVWEKVDGFLCTTYRWKGKNYIASKGSFTSPHAKWATAQIQKLNMTEAAIPGYTYVFEGICPSLRIVVDYGKQEELVLLAIINNKTGAEVGPTLLQQEARVIGVRAAKTFDINWQEAHSRSYDDTLRNEEGYVLTWYRDGETPFRLKIKFADYLRLHRMVTGVSPKHILEVLQNGWTSEMDGLLNESTPWFNKFVSKWKRVIENEYERIHNQSLSIFHNIKSAMHSQYLSTGVFPTRKDFALLYTNIETHKEFAPVLFALLDGKDERDVIWKMVKRAPFMKNGSPMVDAHNI